MTIENATFLINRTVESGMIKVSDLTTVLKVIPKAGPIKLQVVMGQVLTMVGVI